MPLVPGICTQCGATLSVDNEKDCMVCNYCGAPFIVEKAINQFSVQYNITNNIQAQQVIIQAPQEETGLKLTDSTVMGCGKLTGEVVIPEGITRINYQALKGAEMTSIVFPSTMKEIGDNALCGCKFLKKVVLNEGLEIIGECAFVGCDTLKEISLPNTLKKVGHCAFSQCRELETIHFNHTAPEYGYGVFEKCPSLSYVELPDTMKVLPEAMFRSCTGIKRINFNQVERIEVAAIQYCEALEELVLSNVTYLYWNNFTGLKNVRVLVLNSKFGGVNYSDDYDISNYGSGDNRFRELVGLEEVYWGEQRQTEKVSEGFLNCVAWKDSSGRLRNLTKNLADTPFRRAMFRRMGRCQYCGEPFQRAGIFDSSRVCSERTCGKPKDY